MVSGVPAALRCAQEVLVDGKPPVHHSRLHRHCLGDRHLACAPALNLPSAAARRTGPGAAKDLADACQSAGDTGCYRCSTAPDAGYGRRVEPRWCSGPESITLVRHGESLGNRADFAARESGAERLELDERDADVELSSVGREQAAAVGRWMDRAPQEWRPSVVLSSPYRRAAETARLAVRRADVELELDERLRERDLGVLDGLTGRGIRAHYPDESVRRSRLGKFYYQPPSGESWADVVLRVRSLLGDLRHGHEGERIWLFTHQAVIMAFRYVLEGLEEQRLLEIDREVDIPNASLTRYRRAGSSFELDTFADTRAIEDAHAEVTEERPR